MTTERTQQTVSLPRYARRHLVSRQTIRQVAIHVVLILVAVTMIFPLLWMLSTSLKAPSKQFSFPPQLVPNPIYFGNYVQLFETTPMLRYLFNSTKIATLSVLGDCMASSLAAFAFARMQFRGKEILFSILLATLMIPGQVTVIPTFAIIRWLGWINTHAALIVPSFFGGAFSVFLIRQFFRTVPEELVDAAKIDGAGFFRIYWRIFLPLGLPAIATVATFDFLGSWNDLFGPLIFLNDQSKMTVTQGLAMLVGKGGTTGGQWGVIMAGALMGVIPTLLLYLIGQKYFVQGLARAGLKG